MLASSWSLERLTGISKPDFSRQYFGYRRMLSSDHDSSRFQDLITLDDVDEILGTRALRVPLVWIVKDGKPVPEWDYTTSSAAQFDHTEGYVDSGRVSRCFSDGASVVMRQMQRYWQPLADFAADMAADIGHGTRVNGYITPHQSQGLRPHYDDHDVFILQIDGRKEWFEYSHDADLPVPQQSSMMVGRGQEEAEDARPEVTGSVILEPGDVLYIPRGSVHAARALQDLSFHLTLSVLAVTVLDLAESLASASVQQRGMRQGLPIGFAADPEKFVDQSLPEVLHQLSSFGTEADRQDLGWALTKRRFAELPDSPVRPFAQYRCARDLSPQTLLRRRSRLLWQLSKRDDRLELRLRDRTLRFSPSQEPLVRRLMSADEISVAQAVRLSEDTDSAFQVVRDLVRECVIESFS